jgi:hypothetical protein
MCPRGEGVELPPKDGRFRISPNECEPGGGPTLVAAELGSPLAPLDRLEPGRDESPGL